MDKTLDDYLEKLNDYLEKFNDNFYKIKANSDMTKLLFMSDVDIGTKLFDPNSFDGLGRVIEEEQPDTIIVSQIFPFIPIHQGERLKEFFRVIDNDILKKYGREVWQRVKKERESNKSNQSLVMDSINTSGIRNLNEIAIISSFLFNEKIYNYVPEKTRIIYLWSEADWKNVGSLRQQIIAEEYAMYILKLRNKRKETKDELRKLQAQAKNLKNPPKETTEKIKELNKTLYQIDEELWRSRWADFTKTWREDPQMEQKATDKSRKIYENMIKTSFGELSDKLEIVPYNVLKLFSKDSEILVSYNLNMPYSNTPLTSSIQRDRLLLRILESRGDINGEKLKMVIDGSIHKGGFRVLADNLTENGCNPVYIIKPPTFNEWSFELAIEKVYKAKPLKAGVYEPYASGIIIPSIDDRKADIRYVSGKRLSNYKNRRGRKQKAIFAGDFHLGSLNNDVNQMTNYELLNRVTNYILKDEPNVLVLTGDLIEGEHLPQITFRMENMTMYEREKELERIFREDKSNKRKLDDIKSLIQQSGIINVSLQKKELKERFIDKIIPLVRRNKTEIIIITGQHYNKSTGYKEDEATEVAMMFPEELSNYVYAVSGDDIGVGTVKTNNRTEFYLIHGPRITNAFHLDPGYALLKQAIKSGTKAKIIVAGDRHLGAVAIGDGKISIVSPSLEEVTPFMKKLGDTQQPRGIMEVFYKIDRYGTPYADDVKIRYLLDPFWYSYKA